MTYSKLIRWRSAAWALSVMVAMAGCNPLDDSSKTNDDDSGGDDTPKVSASGYVFPDDAFFISEDAANGSNISEAINEALFDLPANSVVVLPAGEFSIDSTVTIAAADGLTIAGWGMNATILDFSGSTADDSIKFEGGANITIRDLGVYESPKNAIKAIGVNGIHFDYVATVWESPLDDDDDATTNGAYGIYPLQSQNVLIENSYAKGSADAGIYVGQSNNIVVRNNTAEHNVAGIEIENSTMADVYNNTAIGNTGGILVFDLPGLDQAYGGNIRIFNNESSSNNLENFGGGTVGIVPPGTGFLVFAASDVELYDNITANNETAAFEIASYFLADDDVTSYVVGDGSGNYEGTIIDGWSPLVKNVYIHDNTLSDNGDDARGDLISDVVDGWALMDERFPSVLYGGIGELLSNAGALTDWDLVRAGAGKTDTIDHDAYSAADLICVNNNIDDNSDEKPLNIGQVYGVDPAPEAGNFDVDSNPVETLPIQPLTGATIMNCTQTRLAPATVTFKGEAFGCTGDDLQEAACAL